MQGCAPIRLSHEPRHDVGQKHRRQQQEEPLDSVEAAAQHQQRHDDCGRWNADIPGDTENFETGCNTGEFSAGSSDVGDDQCSQNRAADGDSVALAHQADQSLAGDDTHPCRQTVEHDQRHRRQQ